MNRLLKIDSFIIFITVLLLLIPRYNLVSISGQTAGIRVDDLVLLFLFSIFLFRGRLFALNLNKFDIIYFSYVIVLIASFFFNSFYGKNLLGSETSILYPIRYIEYFIFFLVGSIIRDEKLFIKIIFIFSVYQVILIIFQSFGFVPSFTSTDGIIYGKVAGSTGGPWEVSIVLSLCFAVYVNHFAKNKYLIYSILITLTLSYLYIYLLGSRTSAISILILALILFFFHTKILLSKIPFAKIFVIIAIFVAIPSFFVFQSKTIELQDEIIVKNCHAFPDEFKCDEQLFSRSEDLLNLNNLYTAIDFYNFAKNSIDDEKVPIGEVYSRSGGSEKLNIQLADENNMDLSWFMRIEKWTYGILIWQDRMPYSIFFGIGPGSTGPSFDGNWIRLVVESGFIGFLLIVTLFLF